MTNGRTITIATRGSRLAMIQTEITQKKLAALGVETKILVVSTKGDKDQASPLQEIGGDGLFVRGIEQALLEGAADIAVHSGKDLPYKLMDGLVIAGVPDEADPRDCLIMNRGTGTAQASQDAHGQPGPVIGTSSPRRDLAAKELIPGCVTRPIRGNVPTRIGKLRAGGYDGIILACAGIDRLGEDLTGLEKRIFTEDEMIPAPCQGMLAAECRADDEFSIRLLEEITDPLAKIRFDAERCLFCQLEADCSAAIAVNAAIDGDNVTIRSMFNGRRAERRGPLAGYKDICDELLREIYIRDI